MVSQSAPAHRTLPAVEDGPHLEVDAIRAIREHLWAGALDVSQPLLDVDMDDGEVSCSCLGRVKCAPSQAAAAANVPVTGYCTRYAHLSVQRTPDSFLLRPQLSVGDLGYNNRLVYLDHHPTQPLPESCGMCYTRQTYTDSDN